MTGRLVRLVLYVLYFPGGTLRFSPVESRLVSDEFRRNAVDVGETGPTRASVFRVRSGMVMNLNPVP